MNSIDVGHLNKKKDINSSHLKELQPNNHNSRYTDIHYSKIDMNINTY